VRSSVVRPAEPCDPASPATVKHTVPKRDLSTRPVNIDALLAARTIVHVDVGISTVPRVPFVRCKPKRNARCAAPIARSTEARYRFSSGASTVFPVRIYIKRGHTLAVIKIDRMTRARSERERERESASG